MLIPVDECVFFLHLLDEMHEFQLSLGFFKFVILAKATLVVVNISDKLLVCVKDLSSFKAHLRDF